MTHYWRHDDEESLKNTCPTCHRPPGRWCVYVGNVLRAGTETTRLHNTRTNELWIQEPAISPKKHRRTAALTALRTYDQQQQRELRAWLRQYVHLLLDIGSP